MAELLGATQLAFRRSVAEIAKFQQTRGPDPCLMKVAIFFQSSMLHCCLLVWDLEEWIDRVIGGLEMNQVEYMRIFFRNSFENYKGVLRAVRAGGDLVGGYFSLRDDRRCCIR